MTRDESFVCAWCRVFACVPKGEKEREKDAVGDREPEREKEETPRAPTLSFLRDLRLARDGACIDVIPRIRPRRRARLAR